jgi:hypothetical protein
VRWALLQTDAPLKQALALDGWRCQAEDDQGVATLCVRPAASANTRATRLRSDA